MGMKEKTWLSIFAAILTATLASPGPASAENIVIGVFLPLSGANTVIGHMQENAMLMAAEEVNRSGVFAGGRRLELDIRNGGRRAEDTRNIVNHFIRDKQYPVIIGGAGSTAAAEAARWCQRGLTPLIVVTASEDKITRDGLDYIFRIAPPISHYGDAAIEFVREVVRPDNVALITEGSGYGEAMREVIRSAAVKGRWNLMSETGPGLLPAVPTGPVATRSDTVFMAVFPPDAVPVIDEIRSGGSSKQTIVSLVPSSVLEDALIACGERCSGVFSTALWFDGADRSADTFNKKYTERFGVKPDYHAAQAYAAVLAAASSLRNIDTKNREAVRDSLKKTRIGSPFGTVAFADWEGFTNQNRPLSYLFQWFGDHFEVVWPVRYRTAEPIR